MIRNFSAFLVLFCFLLLPIKGFSQEAETTYIIPQPKVNLFTDTVYAFLGVTTTNVFLNYANRLANAHFANMTFTDIWDNIYADPDWMWEDGDRFHINQVGHAYLGAVYFASARVNGFNFYQSMPYVFIGAAMWEMIFEPEPAYNDVISTTVSGMALGEIMYRLFLEADSKQGFGARVGGFFLSPSASQSKIYNRPIRERGGGNIYDLSLRFGGEKSFASFPSHEKHERSWKNPGGFIDVDVVYGDPFLQQSKKPYDHFDLFAGFAMTNTSYQAAIVSDGYLFSVNTVDTDKKTTSTGLSMHYDFYDASNDFKDNVGYGNIPFSSSAIGWALKHKYRFSESSHLEIKTHVNAVLWGASNYNMYETEDTAAEYWVDIGNTRCTFGMGENVKLSFSLSHKRAGTLTLNAYGYHIFVLPVPFNESKGKRSTGNVFFLYSTVSYDFPFTERVGIGIKGNLWWLYGLYNSADNVNRRLLPVGFYTWFRL
jgi:hypothetical protein